MKTKQDCRSCDGQHLHRSATTSMSNNLMSTNDMRHRDNCCGIHGAARARKAIKSATVHLSRRRAKELIRKYNSEE